MNHLRKHDQNRGGDRVCLQSWCGEDLSEIRGKNLVQTLVNASSDNHETYLGSHHRKLADKSGQCSLDQRQQSCGLLSAIIDGKLLGVR